MSVALPANHAPHSTWSIRSGWDKIAYAAEAFIAHLVFQDYADADWYGSNPEGFDVVGGYAESLYPLEAAIRIDAKVAWMTELATETAGERVPALEFKVGRREQQQAPEVVTHYGLVVFVDTEDSGKTSVRSPEVTGGKPTVSITGTYQIDRAFLVPRDAVNRLFRPSVTGERARSSAPLIDLVSYELDLTGPPLTTRRPSSSDGA